MKEKEEKKTIETEVEAEEYKEEEVEEWTGGKGKE